MDKNIAKSEGAFVDLLNQEMKELQDGLKQKQIEEMARDMDYGCVKRDLYPDDAKEIAKALYLLGYRKIPENAVVMTREDLNELEYKAYARGVNSFNTLHEKQLEKTRKGTAEKFADRVKMAFYYEFDELIPSIMADKIDEICKEITEGEDNG